MRKLSLSRVGLGFAVASCVGFLAAGSARADFNDCPFHFGAFTGEENVVAKTTSANGNSAFRIYRNNQDIYNDVYGHQRYSEMFAVPCEGIGWDRGTYWVAFSKTKTYLRLPPNEEDISYCLAANNQPGVVNPGKCNPLDNSAWVDFDRRLQAEPGDSIAIHAHYPIPNAQGVLQDTDSYFGLTALEAVAGRANDFNTSSTVQLDDIDVWVDDVESHTTYLLTTVRAGTSADLFSIAGYHRYSEVRFKGHRGGPVAIGEFTPDMTWWDD